MRFWISIVIGTGFFIASIWLIWTGLDIRRKRKLINRDGVLTTGTIIERKSEKNEPGRVFYTFQHEGQSYRGNQQVSTIRMDVINIGDTVEIRYLPYKPAVALLAGKDEDNPLSRRPLIGTLLLIFSVLTLYTTLN